MENLPKVLPEEIKIIWPAEIHTLGDYQQIKDTKVKLYAIDNLHKIHIYIYITAYVSLAN